MEVMPKANRQISVALERGGRPLEIKAVPASVGKYTLGDLGLMPEMHPQITSLQHGAPGIEAGLRPGDLVMAAAGERDVTQKRLVELIKAHEGKPLPLVIRRNGVEQAITVTPRQLGTAVMIGAQLSPFEVQTVDPGPIDAVKLSLAKNWEWTRQIVETLAGLFTRTTSVKQLMGPVAIADLSGNAAEAGWISLFTLMAMISLNLGLLNLMPIPVLDGGHIFILAMEGLARRDFSMRVKEKMLLAGFVLLLALMVTVIYNDLMRIQWIEKFVPWR